MSDLPPVVVELIADLGRYRAEMVNTAKRVDTALVGQERSIKRLEGQIRSSSSAISSTLAGLAGVFAGAFSVQAVAQLADSFTRLQNSLKVAGLEGAVLADVQQRLLELSGRNGVAIEGLAGLYGSISQSQRELGASSNDIIALTKATAESLRVTGTSAVQAQGAILGLTQAMASGRVKAEEFNQINEGGLRPLLQAAANTERFGGSVAALRAAIIDGKVSSQELYQGILVNAAQITDQASKATLTLSGSMEALRSQFVVFIGQADQSLGVTAAVTQGMKLLGDNIGIVAQALAVLATFAAGRFVVSMTASGAAMLIAARNAVVLTAAATGATRQLQVMALTGRFAGASLLAALGGPVGAGILAIGVALAIAASRTSDLSRASSSLRASHERVTASSDAAKRAIDRLATSYGRAREEALSLVRAQRQVAAAEMARTTNDLMRAEREFARQREVERSMGGRAGGYAPSSTAAADVTVARDAARTALQTFMSLEDALRQPPPQAVAPGAGAPSTGTSRSGGRVRSATPSGPSQEDINQRFTDELFGLLQQRISSQSQLAQTAEEEAEIARRGVEWTRGQALGAIERDKDYSAAQKERLRRVVENIAADELERIARDERLRLEQEAADLAQAETQGRVQALRAQADLADNSQDRLALALQIFDLEEQERRAALERLVASQDVTEAVKARARAELAALNNSAGVRREGVAAQNESPAQRFMRELNRSSGAINEDLEAIAVNGLDNLNDGITEAIMGAENLGDVFKGVANSIIRDLIRIAVQQAIIKPLADSLFGGGSGGGGGFLSSLGSIFGRASGGYVAPGQMVRVNEASSPGRVEGFRPMGGGNIVPLGQMNAMAAKSSGGGGVVTVRLDLSGDIDARITSRSADVAVEVVKAAAPALIGAAKDATLNTLTRPNI